MVPTAPRHPPQSIPANAALLRQTTSSFPGEMHKHPSLSWFPGGSCSHLLVNEEWAGLVVHCMAEQPRIRRQAPHALGVPLQVGVRACVQPCSLSKHT